jgi:hypothetical protein
MMQWLAGNEAAAATIEQQSPGKFHRIFHLLASSPTATANTAALEMIPRI